jgi:iron complex transport system substrate-binding protein
MPTDHDLRIVSLLPSITEILACLGLSEQIVGITHCCDYPFSALEGATVVTTSELRPSQLSQEEIHERVSGSLRTGDSLYALDEDALKRINPTHVFTQSLCDICAVSAPLVKSTCARIFNNKDFADDDDNNDRATTGPNKVISLEPQSLDQVWETIRIAGRVLGREDQAETIIAGYLQDLEEIKTLVNDHLAANGIIKPKVAFLEWHDPFVSGGHWIADMMKIAGGNYTLNKSGQRSQCISDEELIKYDPDVILIGPCGFTVERATQDTLPLLNHKTRSCWKQLRAVQDDQVYALDGNSFYARPGPRLVQGTGLMAKCLYPDLEIPERLAPSSGMKQITMDMYTAGPVEA